MYNTKKQQNDISQLEDISKVGTTFFYETILGMNERIKSFPTTAILCQEIISSLGVFITDNHQTEGVKLLKVAFSRPDLIEHFVIMFNPLYSPPKDYLLMYKFLVDAYLKKWDLDILNVLLQKFEMKSWLFSFKPKLVDVTMLLKFILEGLETWAQIQTNPKHAKVQLLFRNNFVTIFEHNFPEHYGEVLQIALKTISEQKVMPQVLLDLINSLYRKVDCSAVWETVKYKENFLQFANKQNILPYQQLLDTAALLAKHFQNERLQHGLHGLYPKHQQYCEVISILFGTIGYSTIVQGIHSYPAVLADQCEFFFLIIYL